MPLPTREVLGILVDNLRTRRNVFPLSRRKATRWSRGLDLPVGGEVVLYTGLMYQLVPYIEALVARMERLEDSRLTRWFGLGRRINRTTNLARYLAFASRARRRAADASLRDVARLLRRAGVAFGYLYGDELYAGALVHDQGADKVFRAHAAAVRDLLAEHGVKTVITVDPHTTHMLRSVYPEVVDGFAVGVKTYLEVLAESDLPPARTLASELVVHDSCVYARHEGLVREPRALLERAGVVVREPADSGEYTRCCGGPIESLFPSAARKVAAERIEQLAEAGKHAVTMCPICHVNLERSAGDRISVRDISAVLAAAYCDDATGDAAEDRKPTAQEVQ
jgi:Fe-S oxidoreductase